MLLCSGKGKLFSKTGVSYTIHAELQAFLTPVQLVCKNQIGGSNEEKSVSWFQKNAWESSCLPVGLFVVRSSGALHNYFEVQIIKIKFFAPYVVPPSLLKVVM